MNAIVVVVGVLVAADVAQRAAQLRDWSRTERSVAAVGLVGLSLVTVAVATPLLDRLDISAPNLQIAAGLVVTLWAIVASATWLTDPAPSPVLGGLVPGTFPLLFIPPVGLLVLAAGARNGFPAPLLGAVAAAAVIVAVPSGAIGRRVARALTASAAVAVGITTMIDGVLAV